MAVGDYATVPQVRRLAGITDTDSDALIADMIPRISRQVDRWCRRFFYEKVATISFDLQTSTRLWLNPWDLLSITTLTNGDGTVLTQGTHFLCYPEFGPPYRWIDRKSDGQYLFTSSGTSQQSISIAGKWGYHTDYSNAWTSTGQTVKDVGGITALATSLSVDDANSFSVRETIKVDNEQMLITECNTSPHTLTVVRAINGTVAVVHANAAAITRWVVEADVAGAVTEWAVFIMNTAPQGGLSRQRMGDYEEAISFFLLEQTSKGPPGGVRVLLSPLRRIDFKQQRDV
jgi:hypothetical protein